MTYMLLSISFRRYNNLIIERAQAPTIFDYSGQSMRFKVANYSRLEIRLDTLQRSHASNLIMTKTRSVISIQQRTTSSTSVGLPYCYSGIETIKVFMSTLVVCQDCHRLRLRFQMSNATDFCFVSLYYLVFSFMFRTLRTECVANKPILS